MKIEWVEFTKPPEVFIGEETKRVKKQTRVKDDRLNKVSSETLAPPEDTVDLRPNSQLGFKGDGADNFQPNQTNLSESDVASESRSFLKMARPTGSLPIDQRVQTALPSDLQVGDIVALNTDQNLYYSFHRRLGEKIVWAWIQHVISGFQKLQLEGRLKGPQTWVTIVEAILDKDGRVLDVQPMQLSGYWEIDGAAIKAIKQAKIFPNPPEGMIGDDGYIRIQYKFTVFYRTGRR